MKHFIKNIYLNLLLVVVFLIGSESYSKGTNVEYSKETISNYFTGIISARQDNTKKAFKHLNKIQSIKKTHDNFSIEFIRTLVLLEKFDQAINLLKGIATDSSIIENQKEQARVLDNLAYARWKAGKNAVVQDFQKPLQLRHSVNDRRGLIASYTHLGEFYSERNSTIAGRYFDSVIQLSKVGSVNVEAKVLFSPETPMTVAQGLVEAPSGLRTSGDTVNLHAPRHRKFIKGGQRLVEVVVNGQVVAKKIVPANGAIHDLNFEVDVTRSSWIAIRHFPQLHTNPVNVIVEGRPIRASRESALWCKESVKLLWENRNRFITESERNEAKMAYDRAVKIYDQIANESPSIR